MSEQEQHARELLVKELGFELFDDPNYPSGPMRMIGVRLLRNRLASKDEAVMWKLLLKRESELSSLRAEVTEARETLKSRYEELTQLKLDHAKQFDDYRIGLLEAIDVEAGAHALRAAEVQSLRAEVERLRTTVEEREKLLDRFTANNIKLNQELERLKQARKHTQDWYARHYGKVQDWARKILPYPYRDQFFSCVANGTWGFEDVGEPYMTPVGMVTPSGYIKFDSAQEQILHDQTSRAEAAELRAAALEVALSEARKET